MEGGIVDGGSEVEGGCVEDNSSATLGGSLVGGGGGSLSTKISGEILSDGRFVQGAWRFRGIRGSAHPVAAWNT